MAGNKPRRIRYTARTRCLPASGAMLPVFETAGEEGKSAVAANRHHALVVIAIAVVYCRLGLGS